MRGLWRYFEKIRFSSLVLTTLTFSAIFSFFLLFTFSIVCLFAGHLPTIAAESEASVHSGSLDYSASISNNEIVSVPIVPTSNQEIYTATNQINYANTCPSGFDISISSSSSNTSLLRSGDDSGIKEIPTISSDETTLSDNTWGFSTDNGETFLPIPDLSNPKKLLSATEETSGALDVVYGIKINDTTPAGSYVNDMIYTVSFPITCTSYTLYFDPDGGTIIDSSYDYEGQTLDYGTVINLSNYKPKKAGYTFNGWKSGSYNFTGDETNINVNPTNLITNVLTADWSIIDYSIFYELDGGSATNPTSYNVESDDFTLNNPTKTGHTFSGWTGTDLSSATKDVTIPKGSTEDRSYTATWTANTYTLTYNNQSGSGCSTKTGTYGGTWGTLCTPSRTGHTFGGWFTGTGGSGTQITANSAISDNLTIYAKWTANTYTLTYDNQSGSGCSSKTGTYGGKWGTLCTPSRTGHTFGGWFTGTGGSGTQITANSTVSGNQKVYAKWTANTYTLTYDNQSGSGCSSKTGSYGGKWGTLCTPSRGGDVYYNYTFAGWFTGTGGSGTQITANSTVSGNQRVYAKWNASARCSSNGRFLAGSCWYLLTPPSSWDVGYSFAESQSNCPSGYHTATKDQVQRLSDLGAAVYSYFGLNDAYYFWTSSTYWENGNEYGNHLYVSNVGNYVGYYPKNRYAVTESGRNVKNGTACII